MKSAFEEADIIGRDKTKKALTKYELVESTDEYSVWDMSGCTHTIEAGDKPFFLEIKNRKFSHDKEETVFLEYQKLVDLRHVAKYNGDADYFYVNTFTDNVVLVFNLKKLKLDEVYFKVMELDKHTVINSFETQKLIIELPTKLAKKYKIPSQ